MNTACACHHPHGMALTRRELAPLGLAGMALAGVPVSLRAASPGPAPAAGAGLSAFALDRVRLLDGPWRDAQQRTLAYLLSLDPDRLLHGFRVNAGLPPRGAVYGGWESRPDWADIHCQGHTLGHYLSGCALMFAATGDPRLRQRLDHIVAELAACQKAAGSGLVCAFPEGPRLMAAMLAGQPVTGVPWYTLHKVFAGLRDADLVAGVTAARPVLLALADWTVVATRPLDDAAFEAMLAIEHGGMNEVFADLHALTGREDYARLARRFSHKALLTPLAQGQDHLDGLHANTQVPKVVGFQRVAETQGDADYARAAAFFWQTVVSTRSYAGGGHGDGEFFFPVADFAAHVFSAKGSETCGIHNMLKLTQMLLLRDPQAPLTDFAERALINGILGSQDPESGMVTYFQGARPGYVKLFCTPEDSFWCCTGTGMENHAKYGSFIFAHDDRGLWLNQFIASRLAWPERGAVLTQHTRFPEAPTTTLAWQLQQPQMLALHLRHPGWSPWLEVRVNGAVVARSDRPSSYVTVEQTWRDGDTVELAMAMAVEAVPLPGHADIAAFRYGPVVLAGLLDGPAIAPGADLVVNERRYGEYCDAPVPVPQLAGRAAEVAARIKPAGPPLEFTTAAADGATLRFAPYHRVAHRHFATYWKLAPPA
ncbi:hypothetical protein FHT19_001268 [Novosphingobium sp. SG919]|nr:hypothetical protein [Novosphingobium sp. SG919]